MKRSKLVKVVREVIEEMRTTAGLAGYHTPFAFSNGNKKNRTTKKMEKLG